MFSFIARHKIASLMVFLNIIAILVVVLIIVLHNAKTATISIYVAPSEAEIELNGGKYDNFQEYDVMPGTYHVKISMEEMETKEFDFEIFDGEFKRIKTYLLDSEGGFSYYLENPDEVLVLEEAADDEKAKEFVENYEKVTGILDKLPLEYDEYTDNYAYYTNYSIVQDDREDCGKLVCLKIIDRTGGNEQVAKDKIRELGYDLNNYDIVYEYIPIESVRVGDD